MAEDDGRMVVESRSDDSIELYGSVEDDVGMVWGSVTDL